jgi:hypothetical protein
MEKGIHCQIYDMTNAQTTFYLVKSGDAMSEGPKLIRKLTYCWLKFRISCC